MERILFVCRSLKESSNLGYWFKILDHFTKKGYEVHLCAQEIKEMLKPKNIRTISIPRYFKNFLLNEILMPLQTLKRIKRGDYDLIYSHSSRYILADIMGVHFLFSHESIGGAFPFFLRPIEKFSFFPSSKKILTVSRFMKNLLVRGYGIQPSRIRVIHYGVDTSVFNFNLRKSKTTKNLRKRLSENSEHLILYVGGRPFRKGLAYLIEAMKYVGDSRLIISGVKGDEKKYFENLCSKFELRNKVVFTGFLEHEKLRYYYAASDVFVLPSLFDPFGLVVLEAMASGSVPVISRYTGASELIEPLKNGLIINDPRNPKEIASRIRTALEDKSLRKRMQRSAVETASKMDWKKVAEKWEEFFREVYEARSLP